MVCTLPASSPPTAGSVTPPGTTIPPPLLGAIPGSAGWRMPVQYSGILDEHRAVRERVGLFDLSHMGELFVDGPEAGVALAAALVTDPPSLAVGRAHYSMICAPDGGILDDLFSYRLDGWDVPFRTDTETSGVFAGNALGLRKR